MTHRYTPRGYGWRSSRFGWIKERLEGESRSLGDYQAIGQAPPSLSVFWVYSFCLSSFFFFVSFPPFTIFISFIFFPYFLLLLCLRWLNFQRWNVVSPGDVLSVQDSNSCCDISSPEFSVPGQYATLHFFPRGFHPRAFWVKVLLFPSYFFFHMIDHISQLLRTILNIDWVHICI